MCGHKSGDKDDLVFVLSLIAGSSIKLLVSTNMKYIG